MFSLLHKSPGIIIIVRCYLYTDDTPVVPTILKTVMLQKTQNSVFHLPYSNQEGFNSDLVIIIHI
jgi:hypothetical protein